LEKPDSPPQPSDTSPSKPRKEIPVVSVPHDDDMIAEEMADLFEEDQVTHKHGNSEPEGD
jgi:hypothetical protein